MLNFPKITAPAITPPIRAAYFRFLLIIVLSFCEDSLLLFSPLKDKNPEKTSGVEAFSFLLFMTSSKYFTLFCIKSFTTFSFPEKAFVSTSIKFS